MPTPSAHAEKLTHLVHALGKHASFTRKPRRVRFSDEPQCEAASALTDSTEVATLAEDHKYQACESVAKQSETRASAYGNIPL